MIISKDCRDIVVKRVCSQISKTTYSEETTVSAILDKILDFIEETDQIHGFGADKKLFKDYSLDEIMIWSEFADLVLPLSVKLNQQDDSCGELLFIKSRTRTQVVSVEEFNNAQRKLAKMMHINDVNYVSLKSLKKSVNLMDIINRASFSEERTVESSPALLPLSLIDGLSVLFDNDVKNWITFTAQFNRWLRNHLFG